MFVRGSRNSATAALVASAAGLALSHTTLAQTVFYTQNFDSAARNHQSGDPAMIAACGATSVPVFTHTPPARWSWDASGVSTYACRQANCGPCGTQYGVYEWEGWSFALCKYNADGSVNPNGFWGVRTDDQNRQQFTLGRGIVAVADGDEWDDRSPPGADGPAQNCGFYNAWIGSPTLDISGIDSGSLRFAFDSSWRPEGFDDGNGTNNQTAVIQAIYTVNGVAQPAVEVMHWDSDNNGITPGNFFKPDATNETVTLTNAPVGGDERYPGLNVPAGATAVQFRFGYLNAGNDWWWAIDNLHVDATRGGAPAALWSEDFESVTLQPPVNEVPTGCATAYCGQDTYTHDGPGGITVAVDSPASGGVPDYFGWSFMDRAYWNCISGGNGSEFTNGNGLIAVADGDEFDDLPHDAGPLDTTMTIPAFSIASRTRDLLVLSFDSSWRYEDNQTATVEAVFNDAAHTHSMVVTWDSNPLSSHFKPDATNELVAVPLVVPHDATSVSLKFRYVGFNNWYWAIDNLRVFEGEAVVTVANVSPAQASMSVAPNTDYAPCITPWSLTPPSGWTDIWAPSAGCPTDSCGRPEWRGWAFGFKDWWWSRVDNQNRDQFTRGRGYIAIADADEWDDFSDNNSQFNAFLKTPAIPLPSNLSSASLNFDSSWRPEGFDDACSCDPTPPAVSIVSVGFGTPAVITTDAPHGLITGNYVAISGSNSTPSLNGRVRVDVIDATHFSVPVQITAAGNAGTITRRPTNNQTAKIMATYTVGGVDQVPVEVLHWDSDGGRAASGEQIFVAPGPFFYSDDPTHWNEGISLNQSALHIPAGATAAKFEFSLTNARNDWWWAIDNVDFRANNNSIFTEDFEHVPNLSAPPSELPPLDQCFYFSTVEGQGGGFTSSTTGTCSVGDDFTGFNAWLVDAWSRALGGLRTQYLATTAFISDFAARNCDGTNEMLSPSYGINALNADSLTLTFRSGWFAETGHVSTIEVTYNGGVTWNNVLTWNPGNKVTNTDEMISLPLHNPAGSTSVQLRFRDRDSGWWAISGISVSGVVGTPRCTADVDDGSFTGTPDGGVTIDDLLYYLQIFEQGVIAADVDDGSFSGTPDGGVTIDDLLYYLQRFEAGC